MCALQGYEGDRNTDPNSQKTAQAKPGLDRNANKKKKKKKQVVVEEGPSKVIQIILHSEMSSPFIPGYMHANSMAS